MIEIDSDELDRNIDKAVARAVPRYPQDGTKYYQPMRVLSQREVNALLREESRTPQEPHPLLTLPTILPDRP